MELKDFAWRRDPGNPLLPPREAERERQTVEYPALLRLEDH